MVSGLPLMERSCWMLPQPAVPDTQFSVVNGPSGSGSPVAAACTVTMVSKVTVTGWLEPSYVNSALTVIGSLVIGTSPAVTRNRAVKLSPVARSLLTVEESALEVKPSGSSRLMPTVSTFVAPPLTKRAVRMASSPLLRLLSSSSPMI